MPSQLAIGEVMTAGEDAPRKSIFAEENATVLLCDILECTPNDLFEEYHQK